MNSIRSIKRLSLACVVGFATLVFVTHFKCSGAIAEPKANQEMAPRSGGLPVEGKDRFWADGDPANPKIDLKLPSFAPVIQMLGTSVVNISTESKLTPGPGKRKIGKGRRVLPQEIPGLPNSNGMPNGNIPFEFYFQMPDDQDRTFETLGSGFVVDKVGHIITNNHVVEKATKIFVTFQNDKKQYTASVVGRDPKTDLALIKVDGKEGLEPATLGNSDALRPGDWVIAIGNPYRLDHTATVGIVSALSRRVQGGGAYDQYIQTDATINPGNSGGPLFNASGDVIGVNTAIYRDSGSNVGIGFAIPVNLVKTIVAQLYSKGKVTRGWLGVLVQPISPDVAKALSLASESGALVAQVVKGTPAEKAGFQHGDVILRYDGKPVNENDDLPLLVAETPIGKKVQIDILRKGEKKTLSATISELKDAEETVSTATDEEGDILLGMSLQEMTTEIARAMGLEEVTGLVIVDVEPGSVGAKAGLMRGDVILEADGGVVGSQAELKVTLDSGKKSGRPVLLLVRRGENSVFLTVQPE